MFRAIFRCYNIDWAVNEIFVIAPERFLTLHEADTAFNNGTTYKNVVITSLTFKKHVIIIGSSVNVVELVI